MGNNELQSNQSSMAPVPPATLNYASPDKFSMRRLFGALILVGWHGIGLLAVSYVLGFGEFCGRFFDDFGVALPWITIQIVNLCNMAQEHRAAVMSAALTLLAIDGILFYRLRSPLARWVWSLVGSSLLFGAAVAGFILLYLQFQSIITAVGGGSP